MFKKLALATALIAAITPLSSHAQSFNLCGDDNVCLGWSFTGITTTQVKIKLWNASAAGVKGDIEEFAFWGIGNGALASVTYTGGGTTPATTLWQNGVSDLSGKVVTGFLGSHVSNSGGTKGMTTDPQTNGFTAGTFWATNGTSSYLEFTFANSLGTTSTPNVLGAAFRAQSTGTNGGDSMKCVSSSTYKDKGIDICEDGIVRITSTVPEPSTYALMTAGLIGIFGVARRRRNAAKV